MGGRVGRGQLPEKRLPEKRLPEKRLPEKRLPPELLKLQGRFDTWRAQRQLGQRIPGVLWDDASTLAGKFGLHRTASVLKLDYYSLKKRVEQNASNSSSQNSRAQNSQSNASSQKYSRLKNAQPKNAQPKNTQPSEMQAFVELSASPLIDSRQCTIELEDIAGARMRICLNGYDAPDVVALSQQFWESD